MSNPQDPDNPGQQPNPSYSGQQPNPSYPGQQPNPSYPGQQPDPYADPYAQSGQQYQYSPYGDQQYTQQPYEQQSQYGQTQYGQAQYGQTQYGQAQYGQTQYGYGGQPPQGPPPNKNRTGLFVGIGVAVLLVIALVIAAVVFVVRSTNNDPGPDAAGAPTSSQTGGGGCGIPGSGEASPITDRVASGPLSFPVSAAPGWTKESYTVYAQSIAAAGLEKSMGDGQPWQAGAEVGQTNFGSKLDTKEASSRMIQCIADGAGYHTATERRVEQSQPEEIKVDGVPASKVTGKILVTSPGVTVPGDDVTVIVVDSAPQTYLMLVIPIGRDDMAQVGQAIIDQLKVARDV